MTSFANMTQALSSSLPPISPPTNSTTNNGPSEQNNSLTVSMINNILENINKPSCSVQPGPSTSASAITYDMWASLPSTSSIQHTLGPIIRDYSNGVSNVSNNNNTRHQTKEDNSSDSAGTSSSVSVVCFRCEDRTPTNRCLECNDLLCHECCHGPNTECQKDEHTLLPIHQISPIGVKPISTNHEKDIPLCEYHNNPVKYYCEQCMHFICQECTHWLHKNHSFLHIKGAFDSWRIGIIRSIEETKTGTKAVKAAIDKAVSMTKSYDKECLETSIKVKRAMQTYAQIIEDREKYLLDKLERIRLAKLDYLTEQMNILRGILAGLAHTNETLMRSIDSEGFDLFAAHSKGKADIELFASMYKTVYLTEEKVVFTPPQYELVDQLKKQCDIQVSSVLHSHSAIAALSRQSFISTHSHQSVQAYTSLNYHMPVSNNLRPLPDYAGNMSRSISYYDQGIAANVVVEPSITPGTGQAIPGYWRPVKLRPGRSKMPGIPIISFASEGQERGQVSRPWGLCVDRDGNFIVADRRNNRVQIFSNTGEFKYMFGCKGSEPGEFELPAGITTDIYGRIIVVDKDNHRVQIFTSSGNFILKFGSFGKDCGYFQYPWDVAVNSQGHIAVTDTRNHRIQLFSNDGTYITKFVFEGPNPCKALKGPTTPRGITFTTSGNIIVSDFENHRLLMVDPALTRMLAWVGREGSNLGDLNRPSGIVTDDEGHIIVADSKNHRLLLYTNDLRIIGAVDLKSPGLDDKDRPSDVAVTPDGYLVVLFETLPDTARDIAAHGKQYIKVY